MTRTGRDVRGRRPSLPARGLALGSRDSGHAAILPLHYLRQRGPGRGESACELVRFDTDLGKHGDTGDSELHVVRAVADGEADAGALGEPRTSARSAPSRFPAVADLEVVVAQPDVLPLQLHGAGPRLTAAWRAVVARRCWRWTTTIPSLRPAMDLEGVRALVCRATGGLRVADRRRCESSGCCRDDRPRAAPSGGRRASRARRRPGGAARGRARARRARRAFSRSATPSRARRARAARLGATRAGQRRRSSEISRPDGHVVVDPPRRLGERPRRAAAAARGAAAASSTESCTPPTGAAGARSARAPIRRRGLRSARSACAETGAPDARLAAQRPRLDLGRRRRRARRRRRPASSGTPPATSRGRPRAAWPTPPSAPSLRS